MNTSATADMVAEHAWNNLGAKLAMEIGIALRDYQREIAMEPLTGEGWLVLGIAINKNGEQL